MVTDARLTTFQRLVVQGRFSFTPYGEPGRMQPAGREQWQQTRVSGPLPLPYLNIGTYLPVRLSDAFRRQEGVGIAPNLDPKGMLANIGSCLELRMLDKGLTARTFQWLMNEDQASAYFGSAMRAFERIANDVAMLDIQMFALSFQGASIGLVLAIEGMALPGVTGLAGQDFAVNVCENYARRDFTGRNRHDLRGVIIQADFWGVNDFNRGPLSRFGGDNDDVLSLASQLASFRLENIFQAVRHGNFFTANVNGLTTFWYSHEQFSPFMQTLAFPVG